MFNTKICDILDIEYPIIQGGMAWVATHELAQAVSNAGGLGVIAAGAAPVEVVRDEIKKLKKNTDKPFGVNIMLMSPFAEDIVELVCEEKVPVVTTGAGNPGKYMDKFKSNGIKVVPIVPSVALAKRLERQGADALIVEGTEAGGHIGELTTMSLVPQVVDVVDIPVIAAGGIADGRGFLAALSLGAEGIQMGTRFVCSTECIAHDNYKKKIMKAKDRDAIVTGRSTGYPVRVIKNRFSKEYIKLEKEEVPFEELEELGAGRLRLAVKEGDIDNGSLMAGQISGMIKDIKSCEEIINDIIKDAEKELNKLYSFKRGE
ncbi:enoyl-[acyl-carrier-protein] reductase FabK [Anaerosalibacter bizertensis]|uniref:Probable nitronate monooxygenase n=1 Tax=Anaerosalibacter bizertensis TaxID=932217 RepID=A0A9Q4AD28_9FIRM|nr:enoyl-[acyl-carrier-protein] reductase FabK [Anaerosalibacter bizertensis]MBV1818207.1 enoyl-[acyl-carrier-protein] reductase FabK [Bacteroidales bacterium MSK.15.36]MCB5560092.1 enoyl-[acyl-carrier-protein] reductase FabK [Anaerosalibacter bizertensis]MCG4565441.1 enoyl-[acyl-carrier-protein] reductase FabK [Anaerosalibacter bizertensis]MCG4582306.1 enoyl-[acyl-carrier-protein] reductase FabK [Anaerosalibacter bizertensis]MCG4585445.1 enoyl-[acyl-carrier-protein] reductase FabK [Anaerosali